MSDAIEHIAGPLENGIQKCTRCGRVLSDYTNTISPTGQEAPKGFIEGAKIVTKKESWGEQLSLLEYIPYGTYPVIKECIINVYIGGIHTGQIPLEP